MNHSFSFSKRTRWEIGKNLLTRTLEGLKKKGVPVLDLTGTNPTQAGFSFLNSKILEPFQDPKNLIYTPDPHGIKEARQAVCRYYEAQGIRVDPEDIFLTANTSEAYSFIFRLIADPRDGLLAPEPSYPLLDYLTDLHDLVISRYPLYENRSWRIHPEDLKKGGVQKQKIKAVLGVHPNNPTGNYLKKEERAFLNDFCESQGLALVIDEVFFDYFLGEDPLRSPSFAGNDQVLTFTLSGISKILGLPQMKLSWIVLSGPKNLKKIARDRLEIISDTFLSPSTPVQRALASWLKQRPKIQQEIRDRIRSNYEKFLDLTRPFPELRCPGFEGGWSLPLRLPPGQSDEDWAFDLLEKDQVMTHPGFLYDFREENFLVVSLLTRPEIFEEGIRKIAQRVSERRPIIQRPALNT